MHIAFWWESEDTRGKDGKGNVARTERMLIAFWWESEDTRNT
jgi:hypothetical protein